MIDVRVTENDGVDGRGVERERRSIALVPLTSPLDQAAVEEDACAAALDQVARSRDLARGAVKCDLHDDHAVYPPAQANPVAWHRHRTLC